MSQRIQDYLRASAIRDREVVRVGPFTATFTSHDPNAYLNYAIPDATAEPTSHDVTGLIAAFESRSREPRLEYLPGLAPAVEPVLLGAGFAVVDRLPLMQCPSGGEVDAPIPDGITLVTPESDDDLLGLLSAQHEAFKEPAPTDQHLAAARRRAAGGSILLLARDSATGEPVGGGLAVAVRDGISEVAGIAVRSKYERRGIGGVITLHLTRAARAAGAETVFLTPGGDPQERVYSRVGYRRTDSVLFLSRVAS